MSTLPPSSSVPPPAYAHPVPVGEHPEVPDGVTPSGSAASWKWWYSLAAFGAAAGAAIMAALIIGIVAVVLGSQYDDPPPAVNIIATVLQDLCFIGAALFVARLAGPVRPAQFGLRPTRPGPALGWMTLAYLTFVGASAAWVSLLHITSKDDLPDELGVDKSTVALAAVAILVTVVAPIAEEFFFRGFFFTALRNRVGLWWGAALTGIVFGAIHFGSAPAGFIPPLGLFGFLLCLVYARTRSLYPCIALHCINNSIAFGATQHWGAEVIGLCAGSLTAIALVLGAVRARFGPERPVAAVAPVA